MGGKHNGYPLLSFQDYISVRPKIFIISSSACCECVVKLPCMLTFGLLEAMMDVKILESTLLQVDNNNERKVLTSNNLPTLLHIW